MTKSQLYKKARQLVLNEGCSHQEAFDRLKADKSQPEKDIATAVSRVPSAESIDRVATLRVLFLILLLGLLVMRVLVIAFFGLLTDMNTTLMITTLLFSIVVPVMGIVMAVQHNYYQLTTVSILLILALLRSLRHFEADWTALIPLVLYAGAILLGFLIAHQAKVPFREVEQERTTEDGTLVKYATYAFEATGKTSRPDLLDR